MWLWLLTLFFAGAASASSPSVETVPPQCTVAQLAAGTCAPAKLGTRVRISNADVASGDSDCATGTGANLILCEFNGTNWIQATSTSGLSTLPFELDVTDRDGDGAIDGDDIQSAIDFCGAGFTVTDGGCTIVVPQGTINLDQTLIIGTTGGADVAMGLTIVGQGMSESSTGSDPSTDGTTLTWVGADGGTMLQIVAAFNLALKNFGMRMDPGVNGGDDALLGIEFAPDNGSSSTVQGTMIDHVAIQGSTTTRATSGSRGIKFTDPGGSGQADRTVMNEMKIQLVEWAIEADESQAVSNKISNSVISGGAGAIRVAQGNLDAYDNIFICQTDNCVIYWLEKNASETPFKTIIDGNHWEPGASSDGDTFLKIGGGYEAAGANDGITHGLTVTRNSINVGCTAACSVNFINGAINNTTFVDRNQFFKSAGGNQLVNVTVSGQATGSQSFFIWGPGNAAGVATIAAGTVWGTVSFASKVEVKAPRMDAATGLVYNDLNLDWTPDAGEGLVAANLDAIGAAPITIGSADVTAIALITDGAGLGMPNAAAPVTNATGELALDTTVTDHQPLFQYYDGAENMSIIAIDTAQLPALDDEIVKYDAATDKFVLEADAGGGGGWTDAGTFLHPTTSTDDIGNDATGTLWKILDTGAATFASVDTPAHATLGGSTTLKEGVDDGTATFAWKVPDTGLTGNTAYICEVTAGALVPSSCLDTEVRSMYWGAGSVSTDATQCAAPAEVTINSGPKLYTVICADNDASTIYGSTIMPDSWNGGTVTFTQMYIQTAADTAVLNGDIMAQCRGNGEVPSSTWGSEIAIDDAAVVGSNSNDLTTSAAVTPAGTCAAGDALYWRWQLDATGTTTAVATLHTVGFKMEYTSNVGD